MADGYESVDRAKIAMDVVKRTLCADDIRRLCQREDVRASFIGKTYPDKRPRKEWNQSYLDKLYYAVVAESFNLDYLLYLDEVAEYVNQSKIVKQVVIAGVILVVVIIAGVIVYCHTAGSKDAAAVAADSSAAKVLARILKVPAAHLLHI